MTHESLKELKDTHQRKIEEKKTILEAESRETHIFTVLPDLQHNEGSIEFILTMGVKKLMTPIIVDILYLYAHRMGKEEGARLAGLLVSNKDESMILILSYKKDDIGTYFIKKLILKKIK